MPPPVTCANACTSTCRAQLEHRGRVDHARARAARRRASGARRPTRARRARGRRGRAARVGRASSRCSADPGSRCRRSRRPAARRAGRIVAPLDHADREADEVELARLHEVRGAPTSRRRAARSRPRGTRRATPATIVVDDLRDELADRDVVEEEQRLGALRGDVVDRHRDAVDADRVVPAGEPGDHRLRADAVGRRHEHRVVASLARRARRARRSRRCRRSTSGRNVERTCSLISSTAFSPAAMSTPASA